MQNQPAVFSFTGSSIRVIDKSGEPWFVAKDILDALDYSESSKSSRATSHVPEEWRGLHPIHTPSGEQQMTVLSEAGMFFFVNRSDKPKALPFQKWVAGDVLPSIRRTGDYTVPQAPPPAELSVPLADHLALAEEAGDLRDEVAALKDELLEVYRERVPARRVVEKVVYKVPVAATVLMLAYGIPRDKVAEVSGRSRGCLRVHIYTARKEGRLQ